METYKIKLLTRREFVIATIAGTAALAGLPRNIYSAKKRPNVLFILADDLGYGDLSCYGRPDYQTPFLDKLARQGVRFTRAYAAGPVCTPTRCAFITGRYPARLPIGLEEPLNYGNNSVGLPPDHPTAASLLKNNGYETALIGKWHLGFLPEYGPNQHGFDEFFGILSGGVDYFTHKDRSGKLDLYENLSPVERTGYITELLTDRAVKFISRRHDRPFYLSLHYTAPHLPWEGPKDEEVSGRSKDNFAAGGSLKIYAAMMKSLDEGVGTVMKTLGKANLDRNTLVIFTSDNGGERFSYNWPFSARKGVLWEGGLRVPAIVRWPGTIPPGRLTDQTVMTMDWTAMILSVTETQADPNYPLDGQDLLPVIKGSQPSYNRTLFWRTRKQDAVRSGKWKYLKDGDKEYLFDLLSDPGEKVDLKETLPEVLAQLQAEFQKWESQMLPRPK